MIIFKFKTKEEREKEKLEKKVKEIIEKSEKNHNERKNAMLENLNNIIDLVQNNEINNFACVYVQDDQINPVWVARDSDKTSLAITMLHKMFHDDLLSNRHRS